MTDTTHPLAGAVKLEPCRYCGAVIDDMGDADDDGYFAKCSDGSLSVECSECGAIGPAGKTREDAITAWNAPSPTPPADAAHEAYNRGYEDAMYSAGITTNPPADVAGLVERWHEELHGMAAGKALYEGQQEYVRYEDYAALSAYEGSDAEADAISRSIGTMQTIGYAGLGERLRDRETRREFDDWGIMYEAADAITTLSARVAELEALAHRLTEERDRAVKGKP